MSRVKTVNGKRVLLAVKVSEGTAAAVDSARGELLRGAWLTKLIDAALEAEGISTAPLDSLPPRIPAVKTARAEDARAKQTQGQRPKITPPAPKAAPPPPRPPAWRPGRPPGAAIFQDLGGEPVVADAPPAPASARKRCMHPGTRSIGGWCPPCGHLIDTGGCWSAACEAGTCVHPK